jgi:hypothetical protein
MATLARRAAMAAGFAALVPLVLVAPASAAPSPLSVTVTGTDGEGRIEAPGRSCTVGGDGAQWHYDYGGPYGTGVLGNVPGEVRLHVDLHSDRMRFPNTGPPVATAQPAGFLQGLGSYATLLNRRGAVKVRLSSGGSCTAAPTMTFDGSNNYGSGTWSMDQGTGSYRGATGSGTFDLVNEVNPGNDNKFTLKLLGTIDVLGATLKLEQIGTYWASLGADYLTRKVTVMYRVTNTGPGDAYGVRVTQATSPTAGVNPVGPIPQNLGDVLAGQSRIVQVRWQLGLLQPCELVILNCEFDTTLKVDLPDALDRTSVQSATVHATAPNLPPPF